MGAWDSMKEAYVEVGRLAAWGPGLESECCSKNAAQLLASSSKGGFRLASTHLFCELVVSFVGLLEAGLCLAHTVLTHILLGCLLIRPLKWVVASNIANEAIPNRFPP